MFCRAKQAKQARQRYSLTILTVGFGQKINIFLQFQGLKIFYLESFCLSKVFILFRDETIFCSFWHGFCREMTTGTGDVTVSIPSEIMRILCYETLKHGRSSKRLLNVLSNNINMLIFTANYAI